jgi:hypothetical protein
MKRNEGTFLHSKYTVFSDDKIKTGIKNYRNKIGTDKDSLNFNYNCRHLNAHRYRFLEKRDTRL